MVVLSKYLMVPLLRLFIKKETGFNNIPKKGPAILVANHASYIDGVLIHYLTAWHRNRFVRAIQAREYIEKKWYRKFLYCTLLKQIPTNGAITKVKQALEQGQLIQLFPEGTRTYTGKMQKATHTGLGVLALSTHAPIIPIGLRGTWEFWNRHQKIPTFKQCIEVRVGKPMLFRHGKITKKNCLKLQQKVMKEVARLAGQKYPFGL